MKEHDIQIGQNRLIRYLAKHGIDRASMCSDGALHNPVHFPVAAVETTGAVLFADLPGFSRLAAELDPVESAYVTSHFFAWSEGEAVRKYGGIVDKFIGDEVMLVFLPDECQLAPLEAALHTSRAMLDWDVFGFTPRIGVAHGPLAIAVVGTETTKAVSVMGNTVNLAARCAQEAKGGNSVVIASRDEALAKRVFTKNWEVSSPRSFEPKNMREVSVIEASRHAVWVPNFDYLARVREMVNVARTQGSIKVLADESQNPNDGEKEEGRPTTA